MRVPRCTWSVKPGCATHVGILRVILQCSVPIGFPEGLQPIERYFLNGAIVGVGRARPAISNDRVRISTVRSVAEEIPPEIIFSVINGECGLCSRDPLKAGTTRSCVHQGGKDVGSCGV